MFNYVAFINMHINSISFDSTLCSLILYCIHIMRNAIHLGPRIIYTHIDAHTLTMYYVSSIGVLFSAETFEFDT